MDYKDRSYLPPSKGLNFCFQNAVVSILFHLYHFFTSYFFVCLFVRLCFGLCSTVMLGTEPRALDMRANT